MYPMRFISIFLFTITSFFAVGQESDYDKMLKDMYSYTVPLVQPDMVQPWMKEKNTYFLDTRELSEYRISHIQDAVAVGYDDFDISTTQNIPKNAKVVVYCSVGYRSERIGELLIQAGYEHVYNLYGGIFNWVNQGFDVYNDKGEVQKVHAYDKEWGKWVQNDNVEKVY